VGLGSGGKSRANPGRDDASILGAVVKAVQKEWGRQRVVADRNPHRIYEAMAKKPAKSSSETSSTPAAKKAAPAKAPAKSPAKPAGGMPLIDTNLAANAAAAFVGRKLSINSPSAPRVESAAFKNMKMNVAKPQNQGLNNILDTTNQNKKPSNLGGHANKQATAHNQTQRADITRSGVPRRTPG
jgi:hypothetical protein